MSNLPADYPPPFASKDYVKKPDGPADLRIDCGIAIVGGGPAGMACAVRLGQLLGDDPATMEKLGEVPLILLEKGRAPGAHELSVSFVSERDIAPAQATPAVPVSIFSETYSRGSVTCPASALAATVSGDAR